MAATASREPAASSESEPHPPPHAPVRLQSIRYEDVANGSLPVPVDSIGALKAPRPSATASLTSDVGSARKRPRTSPNPPNRIDRESHLDDIKRDSGVAPSLLNPGSECYVESGPAEQPSLPAIVVQDGKGEKRSGLFTAINKARSKGEERPKTAHPTHNRLRSFHGIEAEIPTGNSDDFGDLASDKVTFSNRGSLLFGGKKMQEMLNKRLEETPSFAEGDKETPGEEPVVQEPSTAQAQTTAGHPPEADEKKTGLQSGRRTPSVQMLQAAIQGGRVLSAEEISFSMKVRSMYEHGDENAAQWVVTKSDDSADESTLEASNRDTSTPSLGASQDLKAEKIRERPSWLTSASSEARISYVKEPTELAGGYEDWHDVDHGATDRFGFIDPRRPASDASPATTERGQIQRVATALQLESAQPRRERKLRRKISTARSSRSVPPKPSMDIASSRGPSSLHSYQSATSRAVSSSLFRSRARRVTDGASDMLRLPPGLADVSERGDEGKMAIAARQKETDREKKWTKMARPIRAPGSEKGGGMEFEFDTSDPKLIERTWKGIPESWRAKAWYCFLTSSARKRGNCPSDQELISTYKRLLSIHCADDVQIDVDVPRTINMHIMFRRRYRGGQRTLFRVLHAIALWSPDTGYVQGMASLAATLLVYYHEELAFVMMVRLWTLRGLEQLFQAGFEGLMAALSEFEKDWLGHGPVAAKLDEYGITSTAYGTRWYLTLFNLSIPYAAQLRVWDVFMLLGDATPRLANPAFGGADLDVLHATSAAIMDATQEIVLDSDFEGAMKVLTSFIPIKDEDILMKVAMVEWKMRKKRAGVDVGI
ncbi:hypothetical protein MBLNU230_g8109t1 [Neophaeotheca triangularis]